VDLIALVDHLKYEVRPGLDHELVRGDVEPHHSVDEGDAHHPGAAALDPLGDGSVEPTEEGEDTEVPKIVDHEQRRHELAHAVWRVIRRDGVDQASVRAVAAEAGWSPGALRHYFATQSEMFAFAMRLVVDRIEARIAALDRPGDPREAAEQVLHELLPLDDERRAENEVWLSFTARALIDPELRAQHNEVYDALHQACASALETLSSDGRGGAGPASALQAERLHAVLDGLAVHTALRPELMPPERIVAVMGLHLDALTVRRSP
jgi:AcrR family transcriptional regulator